MKKILIDSKRCNEYVFLNVFAFGILMIGLLIFSTKLSAQNLEWARELDGNGDEQGKSIAIDAKGNVYTTGVFRLTTDFNPGASIFNLTSNGGSDDIFISKLDASGNFVWAKQIGNINNEEGNSIAVDTLGNAYIIGGFKGTVDFNPGSGTYNLTSVGFPNSWDIFILKLDSSGNFVWAKQMGGTNDDVGKSIIIDDSGNILTTGYFSGAGDFDPGPGVFNLLGGGGGTNKDVFILKLDASGNFVWAKQMGGPGNDIGYSIKADILGNVNTTGVFSGTVDFDPGSGVFNISGYGGSEDIYVSKLDAFGNLVWAKHMGGTSNSEWGNSIAVDALGNVYTTGQFSGSADFDPGTGNFNLISAGGSNDIFISKLDSSGNFVWAKGIGGNDQDCGFSIAIDGLGYLYITGYFSDTVDFDPGAGYYPLATIGFKDIFISKLDSSGNLVWIGQIGGTNQDVGNSIAVDTLMNVYTTGRVYIKADFDMGIGAYYLSSLNGFLSSFTFIQKLSQKHVFGKVYFDINENCLQESNETGLAGRLAIINPGNIIVETNSAGIWLIDSLAPGNYTITIDTSGNWRRTCPISQNFTIINSFDFTFAPSFGFVSTVSCPAPEVSICMPFQRRCFSNQKIYIRTSNENIATGLLSNAYVEVQLDSLILPTSSSINFTSLGNNIYRFDVGTINPGMSTDFWIASTVSCQALLGQTLCMKANLYPNSSCVFDSIPASAPPDFIPCTLPWDMSSISVSGWCQNNSIYFTITNTGELSGGDMDCFSPVRLYIDGQYVWLDSVRLAGGVTDTLVFTGDGRTWRLEVDQHPMHPGNSHPNATIELCGNVGNWTPNLVNILPQDNSDPVVDIYCGEVTGSHDPNDKQGFPIGITSTHFISPNQEIEYMIRFQNTGTDTAFTVVIKDTLDTDLDIFSVSSGVSSHNYSFSMYGPRVLEWTFNNIMLPDSTTDQIGSNGFITFTVHQNNNLADYTEINNSCGIYFDFNDPVITNTTSHVVKRSIQTPSWITQKSITWNGCDGYSYNGYVYTATGIYWQIQGDTLVTLNVIIYNNTGIDLITACNSYIWIDGNTYTINNNIATHTLTNAAGCDSVVLLNLTIITIDNTVIQNGNILTANQPSAIYQWLDCDNSNSHISGEINQSFSATANGNYAVEISFHGCTDMSSCVPITTISINEFIPEKNILIYQNPSNSTVFVDLGNNFNNNYINVKNTLGQEITHVEKITNKITELNIKGASGIYFIEIGSTTREKIVFKIVKP